jgi:inner membrane transporter RhtA
MERDAAGPSLPVAPVTAPAAFSILALLIAMASLAIGASFAKTLFPVAGPAGTATFRLVLAAMVLLLVWRPWRMPLPRRNAIGIFFYGASMGGLNLLFYMSASKIPIGIAVAVQFIGPLVLATAVSHRSVDLFWVFFASVGLLSLLPITEGTPELDPAGIFYALGAGACWVLYIVFGKAASASHAGQATSLGMAVAAILVLPFGISQAGEALISPRLLAAGLLVALLSSAIPHSLQMLALKGLSKRTYSILLSLEPAMSALGAMWLLGETLTDSQAAGVGCIVIASAGCALTSEGKPSPGKPKQPAGPE